MIPMVALLVGSVVPAAPAPPGGRAEAAPVGLERKLCAAWQGGACVGTLTLRPNGTFERRHYTPGNNTLTGTWAVRWDALPPTLILTCTDSDDPRRIGTKEAVKVTRQDDAALAFQSPGGGPPVGYTRAKK
jgi:hypothetical protein